MVIKRQKKGRIIQIHSHDVHESKLSSFAFTSIDELKGDHLTVMIIVTSNADEYFWNSFAGHKAKGSISLLFMLSNLILYLQCTYNLYVLCISGLPQEAYTIWEAYPWRFGKAFCIFKAMLSEVTSYASVLTITAFTIERYVAICHPLKSHKMLDLGLTIKIIIAIWIFSLLCAIPYPIHTRIFYYVHYPGTNTPVLDSLQCNIPPQWQARMGIIFQVSSFLFFIIPMTLITVIYIMIAVALRRTALNRSGSEEKSRGSGTPSNSIKAVLRMLGKRMWIWLNI